MKLTSDLFADFLKCPTKCYLRSTGQDGSGNAYAEWVREQNDGYRAEAGRRLMGELPEVEVSVAPPGAENLKTATWRLALDFPIETETMASRLNAVERVPSQARGRPAQFIPVRFSFFNKLTKDDRLLMGFDALVLSAALGRELAVGRIVHGDDHTTLKVKVASLLGTVQKLTARMSELLAGDSPPDLILNRHCGECEFGETCRRKALEKDDLGLLGGMTEKERKKYHSKGIFTVTQLSYTFRPRRRPKRLRENREEYHHSLKALAIREKKIHVVGSPELNIKGTPVYLDVEGLPDRDFYYLIGVRVSGPEGVVQRSFWADAADDEKSAWDGFVDMLATIEHPVLLHYGNYETSFLKKMCERYGQPAAESVVSRAINSAVNVLSLIFAQVYFPAYSNGLKDIAGFLGFYWSDPSPSGVKAIAWRHEWEQTRTSCLKERLLTYNVEDCLALETVAKALIHIGKTPLGQGAGTNTEDALVHTELMPHETMFPRFSSPLPEFEQVNRAARWDYQRERVYVRSSRRIRKLAARLHRLPANPPRCNKTIVVSEPPVCPSCGGKGYRHLVKTQLVLRDLFFGRNSLKRWIVDYRFRYYWCGKCRIRFGLPSAFWPGTTFGRNLVAFVIYNLLEHHLTQYTVQRILARLFGHRFTSSSQANKFKALAAQYYEECRRLIMERIVGSHLVHVDETRANVGGKTAYVWVFTNLHEVAYFYSQSRDGDIARLKLSNFKGVLISDFYSVYDSFSCPQQKCLLHLIRELNAEMLRNPYDEGLKQIVGGFARVLKEVIETVDRFGLKKHFLHKHHQSVDRFYRQLALADPQTEVAVKCKQRFEKNRDKLFTFLDYDGVPWNNNNAEHAIKAFAALRDVMEGSATPKSVEDYLILLSVCQTCKYSGVDFLNFLRSGEQNINAFDVRHGKVR